MGYGLKTNIADNQLKHAITKVTDVTLPANSFVLNSANNMYEYKIVDKRITSESVVNITLNSASVIIASNAAMSSDINSVDGGVTLSCIKKPTADMTCTYLIF